MAKDKIIITPEMQEEMLRQSREWMFKDQDRKIEKFAILNQTATKGGIVFVGDSITESYPVHEMIHSTLPVYNRGISGYTSKQLKSKLNEMVLDLHPSKVFLLIGTNDSAFGIPYRQSANNIHYICREITGTLKDSTLYLIKVYPVNEEFKDSIGERTNENISRLNSQVVKRIQEMKGVQVLDLKDDLCMDGNLRKIYTHDGLHLNMEGYQQVTEALRDYLK